METYYERSLCTKYHSQGVQTSFYESTPSPSNSLGDQISPGSTRNFGHARTNHPHAPKERNNRGASEFTRVLFEHIPGTKSFRRVASSYRSKESERPHSCTSFPYVHDKLCLSSLRKGDYAFKIDLQDVYFHVPIHPSSRKYLRFAFENKVYQFQVLPFGLNTAPQVFTRLASGLIPLGRLYLRPLQRHFHSLGLTDRFTPPRQSDPLVFATQLRQWQDLHFLTSGIPIRTFQADLTIFRDASTQGWGAHMGDSQISGTWTRTDRQLHINCVELKAVIFALQHWAPVLQGHQVMVATDNSTVVSYINKQGGTRSPTLLRLTVDLFLWLEAQNIIVRARHIPGCLNVIADHLSRQNQPIPTEWSLHPEIVERIFRVWSTPEVDMFATLSNSHLPWFMSPIPVPRALAVDALSQDWQGRSMYMFPPFPLLSKVIQKLRSTQAAELVLVAPWWLTQSWFPHLLRLCVEHPLALPTVGIFCPSRIRSMSRTESRTICTHGGSHVTL